MRPNEIRRQINLKVIAFSEALTFANPKSLAREITILLVVCLLAGAWAVFQFSQFEFTRLCRGFDLWFDSDPARTVANIKSRWAPFHERSFIHPLYSLFIAAPFGALGEIFGLRTYTLTALYVAAQSACYGGASYLAMRLFGLFHIDAILGVVLLYSTASGIYWIGFPEWIAFGATTVLISVVWVAGPVRGYVSGVAQNLISGSVVVTSWAVGFAASLLADWPKLDWRRAYTHTKDALAFIAALTVLQYLIIPTAGRFLTIWTYFGLFSPGSVRRPLHELTTEFFATTLVAPEPGVIQGPRTGPGWGTLIMTSQQQGVPLTPLTIMVLALWAILLTLGVRAATRGCIRANVSLFVGGTIAFLFALHTLFGGEVFLFSLHFAPLLTFVALWGATSRNKLVVRVLCTLLIAASLAHNYPSFTSAVAIHNAVDASWLERSHGLAEFLVRMDCG